MMLIGMLRQIFFKPARPEETHAVCASSRREETHVDNLSSRRVKASGYTLIEILIVLFIISIVSTVALLSIGHNENRQLETFANQLSQVMTLAEEQAMLQPTVLGLSVYQHSFQFASLQSGEKKNNWLPLEDNLLGKHAIPNNIQLNLQVGNNSISANNQENHNPQIIISTDGNITPFTIYISKKGGKPKYAIIGDADGNITTKALS